VKNILGAQHLTARGRETKHCERLRDVTPQRLVCSLVGALGSWRVETIADLQRAFNAVTGLKTRYKAFYNRLAKPEFPAFLRQVYFDLLRQLSQNVLRPAAGSGLARFTDVVIQDGSSFAVHDALRQIFGGRFTKIRPAAVEVHAFMSLFRDQPVRAAVAPDKDPERIFLPDPKALAGKLLLEDRGYQDLGYWAQVHEAGGFFLSRGKSDLNPRVLRVRGPRGEHRRFHGHPLQQVLPRLPRRRLDLIVEWKRPGGDALRLRVVLVWNRRRKDYLVLVTNVPRSVLTARQVAQVYRLRWQIELVFKEWKSYASLHEFPSANPALVEGLIWASLCAAALKRSLAHASQRTAQNVPISTRIVAMCGAHILPRLVRCALSGFRALHAILEDTVRYLQDNAPRAHPARDRIRGRMQFGLEYVGFGD
jgi:hypothetical protein